MTRATGLTRAGPASSKAKNRMDLEALRATIAGQISHPDLLRLLDYWLERCRDGRLPARRDIDPLALPYVIGHLILVDVERDPLRFRYRLIGSSLSLQFNLNLTGRLVDEHPDPTIRRLANEAYATVVTTARPLAYRRDAVINKRVRRYDVLILPLASDGQTVDKILVGMK
ncbi:MAG: PAS domain-containing protein [Alphaproteobacteria bacterium]|nr:PAS domain-containing protein [Alphaproteobacteria bacterium]